MCHHLPLRSGSFPPYEVVSVPDTVTVIPVTTTVAFTCLDVPGHRGHPIVLTGSLLPPMAFADTITDADWLTDATSAAVPVAFSPRRTVRSRLIIT
jgi:hypothetical protein